MFKYLYFSFCALLFVAFIYIAFITFQPIRNVKLEDTKLVTGVVESMYLDTDGDLYIGLKNDSHNYYINRAAPLGIDARKWKKLILNHKISLRHIEKWTPFTRDKVFPHISRISYKDSIIFDEIIPQHGKK